MSKEKKEENAFEKLTYRKLVELYVDWNPHVRPSDAMKMQRKQLESSLNGSDNSTEEWESVDEDKEYTYDGNSYKGRDLLVIFEREGEMAKSKLKTYMDETRQPEVPDENVTTEEEEDQTQPEVQPEADENVTTEEDQTQPDSDVTEEDLDSDDKEQEKTDEIDEEDENATTDEKEDQTQPHLQPEADENATSDDFTGEELGEFYREVNAKNDESTDEDEMVSQREAVASAAAEEEDTDKEKATRKKRKNREDAEEQRQGVSRKGESANVEKAKQRKPTSERLRRRI